MIEQEFYRLLTSTERAGIKQLFNHMEREGFFEAPCSTKHHLAKKGGLAIHSMNVYELASRLAITWNVNVSHSSIIIASLLHDLGKMGDYGKQGYVGNFIKSKEKDENGQYPLIQSESQPFKSNSDLLYVPHEVRSLQIVERFIEVSEQEAFAILMHNGLYGDFKYTLQGKETELYMLIHFADMWASRVVEKGEINES